MKNSHHDKEITMNDGFKKISVKGKLAMMEEILVEGKKRSRIRSLSVRNSENDVGYNDLSVSPPLSL